MIKYKRDLFDYKIVTIPKEIQTIDNFNNVDLEIEISEFQKELNWPKMWTVKDAISRLEKGWYFNVLKINNHIVGWVWLNTIENELCNLYVNKEIRKQGYGKQLIYSIMNLAKDKNINILYCNVDDWNNISQSLFLKCGWSKI